MSEITETKTAGQILYVCLCELRTLCFPMSPVRQLLVKLTSSRDSRERDRESQSSDLSL